MAVVLCMYKIEHRMQIGLRNPRIACSTDQYFGNIPLRELNFNLKRQRRHFKICIPSAIHVLIKA